MKIGSLIKDALILTVITLILGLALSGAKVATQPLIDKAAEESLIKAYNEVCEGYSSSENITGDVLEIFGEDGSNFAASLTSDAGILKASDANGNVLGYIVSATSKGFGGKLNLIIGFNKDGEVTGVKYANTPSETPGVGMKTTKPEFLALWEGKSEIDVSEVDTISGATISSTAFKEAVSYACSLIAEAKNMDGGN